MRKLSLLKSRLWVLMVAFFLSTSSTTALGVIKVIPETGIDPKMSADVQRTADFFNQVLNEDMKIILTRDVDLFICLTQESYAATLRERFHASQDVAVRESKITGGMSNDKFQTVALNGSSSAMHSSQSCASLMGHELFHQVQAQLSNNKNGTSFYWLKEGTADLIGARVAEKSGYQSIDKWKLDRINSLRNASTHALASELFHTDLDKWSTLMEQKKDPYQMADLMVFYLLLQQPNNKGYESIAEYFRLVGSLGDGDKAFEQAFGLKPAQFIVNFQLWFLKMTSQSAQIEIIAQEAVSPEAIADVEHSASLTRQFLEGTWGADLRSSQRIVLTGNKAAYAAAMAKEFGFSPTDAEQKAKNSIWWWNGSTTILDMGSLTSRQQRIFATAATMVSRFQSQVGSQQTVSTMNWLKKGSTNVVAAHIVEMAGVSTLEKYKSSWINNLKKASTLPDLTELKSQQDWITLGNKYGSKTINEMSELASVYLIEKYGFESMNNWFQAFKETGDTEKAFTKVYGISSSQFDTEFKEFLTIQLQETF